jgi:hypothetical protein
VKQAERSEMAIFWSAENRSWRQLRVTCRAARWYMYFQTKNPNLDKFCRVMQWKMVVYYMAVWSILRPYVILGGHLVYFVVIWYIFLRFGILYQEKSGNTGHVTADACAKFSNHTFVGRNKNLAANLHNPLQPLRNLTSTSKANLIFDCVV